jgi:hypothetical protein
MNRALQGNILLIAALGMLLTALGPEIGKLETFAEMLRPAFFGTLFVHIGSVITAYFAGQVKETGVTTRKVVNSITEKTGN